jgi:DNA polymerase III alpha subunit (gram-positive type)
MLKQIFILALDIETNGSDLIRNEIISIGYCAGNLKFENMAKNRINFKYTSKFEPNCWNFWSKYPKVLNKLSQDQLEPDVGIKKFIDYVDTLDDIYDLRIITDNPSFDISFINYYLSKYLERLPINYVHGIGSNYRCIFDTDSYSRGALRQNYSSPWTYDTTVIKKFNLKFDATHSHMPDEDAEYIYKLHISLVNKLES